MKKLKKITKTALIVLTGAVLCSGCATIVGGNKYYAHVTVNKYPTASIYYNGELKGYGSVTFKAPRPEANAFSLTVKKENCDDQTFNFRERSFRGWAFVGTLVTWTGLSVNGGPWLPIPFGVIVDAATGAFWKPDIMEKGVSKIDYKNFTYTLEYTGCKYLESIQTQSTIPVRKTKVDKLKDLQSLLDKGTLTQEEFDKEKKKILDEQD